MVIIKIIAIIIRMDLLLPVSVAMACNDNDSGELFLVSLLQAETVIHLIFAFSVTASELVRKLVWYGRKSNSQPLVATKKNDVQTRNAKAFFRALFENCFIFFLFAF